MKLAWVSLGSLMFMVSGCSSKSNKDDLPEAFAAINKAADAAGMPTKDGEDCKSGGMRFLSKTKAIYCFEGSKSFTVECKGPKGITADLFPECDISKNAVGDLCAPLFASSSCDGKDKEIRCDFTLAEKMQPGKVAVKPCKGPKGCYLEDKTPMCDEGDLIPDGASSATPGE
ncbi:MAG: hypothetical protein U0414_06490 [Polyangiaceae bacterium]